MSGTTYDWSPLFDAINSNVNRYSQQNEYQHMLDQMMGKQVMTPGALGAPQLAAIPSQLNATAPQIPGAPAPRPMTANLNLGGQAATPGTPGSMGYDGPAGQALGPAANSLMPMLRNGPPAMMMPLLLQSMMKNADRQQKIADARITPLSDEEAKQQLGSAYVPGALYGKDISGNITTLEKSDQMSPGAYGQTLQMAKDKNALPMDAYKAAVIKIDQAKANETAKHDRATEAAGDTPPDPNTIKYWAQSVAGGGPMPILGMGKQAAAYRQAILKEVATINGLKGMTGADQNAATGTTKANMTSLAKLTPLRAATEAYEGTMLQNMDLAKSMMAKGAGTTGVPILNRWQNYAKGQYAGDPDVAAFQTAIQTVKNEYAKIQSGSIGNAPVSDSARREAEGMLDPSQTPQQLMANFNYMVKETGNRTRALREQEHALRSGLSGHSDAPQLPNGQGGGGSAPQNIPPGWTLHSDAKGNKAYVSPDGKQFIEAP